MSINIEKISNEELQTLRTGVLKQIEILNGIVENIKQSLEEFEKYDISTRKNTCDIERKIYSFYPFFRSKLDNEKLYIKLNYKFLDMHNKINTIIKDKKDLLQKLQK